MEELLNSKFVRFQCTCVTPDGIFTNRLPAKFPTRPLSQSLDLVLNLTSSLDDFYFCRQCNLLKCQRCSNAEVIQHFCPFCHFEVQGPITQTEKLRCWRNCLLCPVCSCNLVVMEAIPLEDNETLDLIAEPSTTSRSNRKYHYFCHSCKYDSREDNLVFEKSSFLASEMAELEKANDIRFNEANALQLHYDIEHMIPHFFEFNPALYAIEEVTGFDIRVADLFRLRGRAYKSELVRLMKQNPELQESLLVADKARTQHILNLKHIGQAPTLDQSIKGRGHHLPISAMKDRRAEDDGLALHSPPLLSPTGSSHDLSSLGVTANKTINFPQRQPLRSRLEKSCAVCKCRLFTPRSKQMKLHKIENKWPGINYVPRVSYFSVPRLVKDKMISVGLRFSNPLYCKVFVQLSSPLSQDIPWIVAGESNRPEDVLPPDAQVKNPMNPNPDHRFPAPFNHHVHLPTPKFSIETESGEWVDKDGRDLSYLIDDEEDFDLEGDEEELATVHPILPIEKEKFVPPLSFDKENPYKAIISKDQASTSLFLTVTPRGEVGTPVMIPVLLTYSCKLVPKLDSEVEADPTTEPNPNPNPNHLVNTQIVPKTTTKDLAQKVQPDQPSGVISTTDSGREYHTRHTWIYLYLGKVVQ